ncbi:MAG: branched-chain amino acid ABC transporter permease [Candidatus Velthaea sp.]
MTTIILLLVTGLGLGALYFMVAVGLSLTWGLMRVLNLAQGAFLTVGSYAGWSATQALHLAPGWGSWLIALVAAMLAGGVLAALVETVLIRPLYARPVDQILITVGVALALVALVQGIYGSDPREFGLPAWMSSTTALAGAMVPNTRFVAIGIAALIFVLLYLFLERTRFGLIVRAGVENRTMVEALGIDVQKAFTLVFTISGMASGVAGVVAASYFGTIDPGRGTSMLIFALIVVVIGGLGSLSGCALAAMVVGTVQQFLNFYGSSGVGDFAVIGLLALVLLLRPRITWEPAE